MTTDHSQDRKCLIFPEGGKPDSLENPRGTAENQRTTQLTWPWQGIEANYATLNDNVTPVGQNFINYK